MPVTAPVLHQATAAELDPATLYALLRLRVDVFVVEQQCPYPELDGRDLEPSTMHFWATAPADPDRVLGCLRLVAEPNGLGWRIGRVCVDPSARGVGLAATLMRAALTEVGSAPCVLGAQSQLVGFYAAFGFTVAGDEYLEDGIAHRPMRRAG